MPTGTCISKGFYSDFTYLSRFLSILVMSISQNTFQRRLLTVLRFSKYSFPQKLYIQDQKPGAEKT